MSVALSIVLMAFCAQGLVKFAVGFVVPYPTRIRRVASHYQRRGRIISIYTTVTLIIIVALVVLFVTGMHVIRDRHARPQLHYRPRRGDACHPDLLVQRTTIRGQSP